jgi:hypothetical protein
VWVLAVTAYFVLACAISWMVLFPAGREFVLNALAGAGLRLGRRAGALAQQRLRDADALAANGRAAADSLAGFVRRHWLACACGAALVCLPPLAALLRQRARAAAEPHSGPGERAQDEFAAGRKQHHPADGARHDEINGYCQDPHQGRSG